VVGARRLGPFGLSRVLEMPRSPGGNCHHMSYKSLKMQLRVERPSNQCHAPTAGSSQGIQSVRSWRHTSGRRSRVKRDTCVAIGHPSSNLGRNLFPCGVFLSSGVSALSMAHRDNRHPIRWLAQRAHAPGALRALVRCSQPPRWGQTK
jgi:hypothetical protein